MRPTKKTEFCWMAVVASLLLLVSGCAVTPLKKAAISPGSKIGVLVADFPQDLTHIYIGTTVFNNAEKKYPVSFNIAAYVRKTAEDAIRKKGFEPVMLDLGEGERTDLEHVVVASSWDGALSFSPNAEKTLGELKRRYDVDLVIMYTSHDGYVHMPPDNNFKVANYGLFTRSVLGLKTQMVYSNISNTSVKVSPPTINSRGNYYGSELATDITLNDDYGITQDSLLKLEGIVKRRLANFVELTIENSVSEAPARTLEGAFLR